MGAAWTSALALREQHRGIAACAVLPNVSAYYTLAAWLPHISPRSSAAVWLETLQKSGRIFLYASHVCGGAEEAGGNLLQYVWHLGSVTTKLVLVSEVPRVGLVVYYQGLPTLGTVSSSHASWEEDLVRARGAAQPQHAIRTRSKGPKTKVGGSEQRMPRWGAVGRVGFATGAGVIL